jgi:hypothetical protein
MSLGFAPNAMAGTIEEAPVPLPKTVVKAPGLIQLRGPCPLYSEPTRCATRQLTISFQTPAPGKITFVGTAYTRAWAPGTAHLRHVEHVRLHLFTTTSLVATAQPQTATFTLDPKTLALLGTSRGSFVEVKYNLITQESPTLDEQGGGVASYTAVGNNTEALYSCALGTIDATFCQQFVEPTFAFYIISLGAHRVQFSLRAVKPSIDLAVNQGDYFSAPVYPRAGKRVKIYSTYSNRVVATATENSSGVAFTTAPLPPRAYRVANRNEVTKACYYFIVDGRKSPSACATTY